MSQTPAHSAFPRIHPLTLQNLDSLVERNPHPQECQADSAAIICTASNGKRVEFRNWSIPEGPQSDGDQTLFYLEGTLRISPQFIALTAELGHDSPTLIFWNRQSGGMLITSPANSPFFSSADGQTFASDASMDEVNGPWTIWNNVNTTPKRWLCQLHSGKVSLDSTVTILSPTLENRRIELAQLLSSPEVNCKLKASSLDTSLESYLLPPPNLDSAQVDSATKL